MLEEKIKELAKAREVEKIYKSSVQAARDHFEATIFDAVQKYKIATGVRENLETEIHQEAEQIFKDSGEKHPHQAVEVQEKLKVTFDGEKALEYAKAQLKQAVILDEGLFRATVRTWFEKGAAIPDFVKTELIPWIKIKTNLSGYLK